MLGRTPAAGPLEALGPGPAAGAATVGAETCTGLTTPEFVGPHGTVGVGTHCGGEGTQGTLGVGTHGGGGTHGTVGVGTHGGGGTHGTVGVGTHGGGGTHGTVGVGTHGGGGTHGTVGVGTQPGFGVVAQPVCAGLVRPIPWLVSHS